ncbi:hypothetical protein FQ320_22805 [Oceaniovalibus sp. ACAM 378]|nr:hypothetical protein FQ320_22805 [Oceaniovalibus sp. ACAM 378]
MGCKTREPNAIALSGAYEAVVSESNGVLTFEILEPITRSFTLRLRQGLSVAENKQLNADIQGWINDPIPPQGGILDIKLDSRECGLNGAFPNLDEMYVSVFGAGNPSHSGTKIRLLFESYDSIIIRSQKSNEDYFEYQGDGIWAQMSNGNIVATYKETERDPGGFRLLDDKPAIVDFLGTPLEKPRLVFVPHSFAGWRPLWERYAFQWQPTEEFIFDIVRDRMAHSVPFERGVDVYSYIEQVLSDDTLETLVLSDESNQRIGFDGNENRFRILAFAQAIDGDFSQGPEGFLDGQFISHINFNVEGECSGNEVATISLIDVNVEFGAVVDGSGGADIPSDLTISKLEIEGVERDAVEMQIWVQYNPELPDAGTLDEKMPRECNMIWQRVDARLYCSGSSLRQAAEVSGSKFSSGKFMANDYEVGHNFDGFESLWQCDGNRPDLIK